MYYKIHGPGETAAADSWRWPDDDVLRESFANVGATIMGRNMLSLAAGLLNELQLDLVPLLLGRGERLFEKLDPQQIRFELIRTLAGRGVTHLTYRIIK